MDNNSKMIDGYRKDSNQRFDETIISFRDETQVLVTNFDKLDKSFELKKIEIAELRKS